MQKFKVIPTGKGQMYDHLAVIPETEHPFGGNTNAVFVGFVDDQDERSTTGGFYMDPQDVPALIAALQTTLHRATPPPEPTKPAHIKIQGKEWWDKANGNSYFSVRVSVWEKSLQDQPKEFSIPFRYGYGDSYLYEAQKALTASGFECGKGEMQITQWCRENEIPLSYDLERGCTKKEVTNYGNC